MVDGPTLPKAGDTVADKYRIERTLGSGGMSAVYGATHLVTRKRFAIKWLLPDAGSISNDAAQRFIREAQVASHLQHPHVVEVYDVGEIKGSFYMVMEWLEGQSLAARLEESGPLSFHEACALLIPCMQGIDEAHAAGIVHRDLKPANVFLCDATKHAPVRAKVLDFGIAKLSSQNDDISTFTTNPGVVMGTPFYLSPEQLRSDPVDHRTDVYAMGVMFYEVLSGACPFVADSFGDLVREIATASPTPLRTLVPDLPEGVDEVVSCAMARDPLRRFQDLRAMSAALEHLALGGSPHELTRFGVPAPSVGMRPTAAEPNTTQKLSARARAGRLGGPRELATYATAALVLAGVLALLLQRKSTRAPEATQDRQAERALPHLAAPAPVSTTVEPLPSKAPATATTSVAAATEPPRTASRTEHFETVSGSRERSSALEVSASLESNAADRRPKRQQPARLPLQPTATVGRQPAPIETADDPNSRRNPLDMKLQ